MKKLVLVLIIQTFVMATSYATTWETSSKGYWQDASVWVGGVVPDTAISDTFLINHPIVIDNDLIFEPGAYMLIEKDGGICGHQIATVLSNAKLVVHGILELDELYVNSGFVRVFEGNVTLTTFAQIRGQGGTLKVEEEARMVVGEWFECRLPDYAFARTTTASIKKKVANNPIDIYPNPFTTTVVIENSTNEQSEIKVRDITGREVYSITLAFEGNNSIDLSFLTKGVYTLSISTIEGLYATRVVKR